MLGRDGTGFLLVACSPRNRYGRTQWQGHDGPDVASQAVVTLDRDRIARALPGYEIEREVGRGAWGVVLRARHRQLGRPVAIKELPEAFAADPGVRRRFVS